MVRSRMNQAAEHDPLPRHPLRAAEGRYARDPASAPALDAVIGITDAKQWRCAAGSLIAAYSKAGRPRAANPSPECSSSAARQPRTGIGIRRKALDCQSSCEHRTGLMRTDPRVDARGAPSPVSRALCFLARRRKTAALRRKRQRAYGGAHETGRSFGAHGDRNWTPTSAGAEEIAS